MYNHIWKKYLPIIKILLKKSISEDQILDLNRIDFERAGTGRKAGYKFKIEFTAFMKSMLHQRIFLAQAAA